MAPKKPQFRIIKWLHTLFVFCILFGIVYSVAGILYPERVKELEKIVAPQSAQDSTPERGVLGDLIAQVVPTSSPTAVPTPTSAAPTAVPTATRTPTPIPSPTPIPKYSISGTVYYDLDSDTTKDSSETGAPTITITITGDNTATTTTATNGTYSVTLEKGNYTVTMNVPSGYKSTTSNPRTVSLNSNQTVNYGLVPLFTLSGNVFTDTDISTVRDATETGYAGATVTVSGPTPSNTTTDASGNFTLPSLAYGTYSVTVTVPSGYKTTTSNPRSVSLTTNQTVNFGMAQVYTVSGSVFLDNNRNGADDTGDANYTGASVTFSGPTDITVKTGTDGNYSAQLFAGTYTVSTPQPANYQASTPLTQNFAIGPNTTINFGLIPLFTISGSMYEDRNEDGNRGNGDSVESGIVVTLSGAASATTTADSNGVFKFPNLYAGTYTVSYTVPAKKKNTTTTTQTITFNSPTSASTTTSTTPVTKSVEFGLVTLYNVIGKVFVDLNKNGVIEPSEPFYTGARVTLTKSTPESFVTDASGNYRFLDKGSGNYTIAVDTPTGYRSTTANSLNFSLSADRTINFGVVESTTTKVGGQCSANGVDILLVFDDSGSMDEVDPGSGVTKAVAAKRAGSSFIDIVSSHVKNAQYSVVQFSGSGNYPNYSHTRLAQPLTTNAATAKNAIANIPIGGGGTCVECGIVIANTELSNSTRNAQKVVIIITDGASNQVIGSNGVNVAIDSAENAAMAAAINGVNSQNIIYQVIGVGQGSGSFDPIFMQQLADTNGGRFYNSPSTTTLEAIYQSIADDIGTGVVNGLVFNDKNANKLFDAGDAPLPNWTLKASASGSLTPITTTTNNTGNYSFTGLCSNDFTFEQVLQPGWYQTTDTTSYEITVESGNTYDNNNFGNATGFTISGNIVNDFDKNLNYATPDTLFTGNATVFFSGPIRKSVSTVNGQYASGAMPPGTYNVSLVSPLTSGYRMTYPLNGPPPSFQITIGASCTVNGATGASCL